ncbi:JmjC domain-containing protein [Cupriavidus basilensis]|uniref:JmjC domain-containing protein n=1 Tax=Cupriavidus basilensis TaxID=68895 RepID=A0A7M2H972_9BURK|nr:cupin domain-containing protein [Cupriavidus basilensis]QOT81057.1 hypothetical protein F7R26_027190 [Cupriavidus basilensis]
MNSLNFLTDELHIRPYIFESPATEEITTWSEINSLLSSGIIDYPRVRIIGANNEYSKSYSGFLRYSFSERGERRPQLVPGVIHKTMRDGCAVIIDRCEAFLPGVRSLVSEISSTLCCQAWANLYVSPKGPSGFGCHFDDHDIFAIQIHGSKRWSIHPPTYHAPNRGDKSFHLTSPKGKPLREHVLSAGDGLYLPFGYWHDVETVTEISMHVTIGLDFARKLDAFELIYDELAKDRFFRDKIDYSNTLVEAREFKDRLVEAIRDLEMESFLSRLREQRLDKRQKFNLPKF